MNYSDTPTSDRLRPARPITGSIQPGLLFLACLALGLGSQLVCSGCRTASTMGLPFSSGNHNLLGHASKVRASAGHVSGLPTELAKTPLQPHRMEAGDVLVIEPNDFNSPIRFQADQTIQQDGTIDLGSYGTLNVAGMTASEIQETLEQNISACESKKRAEGVLLASYQENRKPETTDIGISVRLVNQESGNIYVMGEVNSPGSYPITGSETVLDAIIAAGGLSANSNEHKIILTRPQLGNGPRTILPVCYQQILQLGDVSTNYQLLPGDRIYVPSLSILEDIRHSLQWRNEKSCPHCSEYSTR